eukprot:11020461-Prorocentrum_lima.AAC.1
MTSSLVGSEMCIRDRGRAGIVGAALVGVVAPDGRPIAGDLSGSTSLDAVSYTHLTLPTICSV